MDARLNDILTGKEGNHLLPFLWMREGHRAELPALIGQVYDSGARAFCVESRPHAHFCEEEWWGDMDVVLDEAEKRGMRVWILDDKHFPTGRANGLVAEKYPHLRKWQLVEEHVDAVGPAPETAFLLHPDDENILIGVYAYRRLSEDESLRGACVDLTGNVRGDFVWFDVPDGVWRVMALYKTRRGTKQPDYIHLIDGDSVRVLIEAVYEPHYARCARYFGSVIAGFFSDEPALGNCQTVNGAGEANPRCQTLGQMGLALPWTDELGERLAEIIGAEYKSRLAALWFDMGDETAGVRVAYMDILTRLWREHFSNQIGEWCRARGVMYIGHVIEDGNAHARLSCSGGHYFRSLDGQDMAGIDLVLHQIMPGFGHFRHAMTAAGGSADPGFYHYVLARLAASHSHIQKRMNGRAMCEIFGAYGWAEGVDTMRRLMDHMLVRGINYFVPHAFSPDYPDPDCPPHFNAGGDNPQFDAFARLMKYTNQVCHLTDGGNEIVSCAVLYHAEAEWSGRKYMLTQEPARRLYDRQLNYDILPIDAIMEQARVSDGALTVGSMRYPALIVPYAEYLPAPFLDRLGRLLSEGARIAFVDGRPAGFTAGDVVALDGTADYVRACGGGDVYPARPFPLLRQYHVRRGGTDVFMLSNESLTEDFDGTVVLPVTGTGVMLDLMNDLMTSVGTDNGRADILLPRGRSCVLLFGGDSLPDLPAGRVYSRRTEITGPWTLTLKYAHGAEPDHTAVIDALYNITGPRGDAGFSGTMRYETTFEARRLPSAIDPGYAGDCVRIILNGADLGWRIGKPSVFDITDAVKDGENRLVIETANTLVHRHHDRFSRKMPIPPSGLLGPVVLLT